MTEFKRSDFVAAAKDLINVMGLADDKGKAFVVDGKANAAALTETLKEYADMIDPETDTADDFAEGTLAILAHIGYTGFDKADEAAEETEEEEIIPEETVAPAATPVKKKAAAAPKADDDLSDDWEEPVPAEPLTLVEQVAQAKRLADLKDLVTGNLEFKKLVPKLKSYMGLAAPRMLKEEMQKIIGKPEVTEKPVKVAKEKKEKKEKTGRKYSRVDAGIDAVKCLDKPVTVEQFITNCITIYAEKTGTEPVLPEQMQTFPKQLIEVLTAFGILEKKDNLISKVA